VANLEFSELKIERGTCYVFFVYDVARSIDLEKVEQRVTQAKQRQNIKHGRRRPEHLEYSPPPLRITETSESLDIGGRRTLPAIDLVLYDFGAVTVLYTIQISGRFASLLDLSVNLYDNETLRSDSRRRVEQLLKDINGAVQEARISEAVEDYVVFHIESLEKPAGIKDLLRDHAHEIAQILRAETRPLSADEVQDALGGRISYGIDDVTVADWNAALVIDSEGDDVCAVLEFANVELLELRYLDRSLDDALARSYEVLTPRHWSPIFGSGVADMRRVGRLQVDSAILFEGVNNALKLLGDQYLARVYRLVSQRFHLAEWDGAIIRKLETLESIYEKISDRVANWRVEVLEWIIILLIAISIVLPFFTDAAH
jgi:hypothetical protein